MQFLLTPVSEVYLIHWPIALNPNGNDPFIPTLPNGKRDVLHDWDQKDTWAQMEALYKKGAQFLVCAFCDIHGLPLPSSITSRQSESYWSIQFLGDDVGEDFTYS
jgi:hypothetical protein